MDAASSSTELAATVTFSDAAVTRLWAFSACRETVSAALLRPAELISSCIDAARSLFSALSTEVLNWEIIAATASLRLSRTRPASVCVWVKRSRSIMLSRKTITVRAISTISSPVCMAGRRALVAPSAKRFMTEARLLSGRVMLRCLVRDVARKPYDVVRTGKHVLVVDIDDRTQRSHAVMTFHPSLKGVGIGLHLQLE